MTKIVPKSSPISPQIRLRDLGGHFEESDKTRAVRRVFPAIIAINCLATAAFFLWSYLQNLAASP